MCEDLKELGRRTLALKLELSMTVWEDYSTRVFSFIKKFRELRESYSKLDRGLYECKSALGLLSIKNELSRELESQIKKSILHALPSVREVYESIPTYSTDETLIQSVLDLVRKLVEKARIDS
jgi:hypothetical protein